MQRAADRRCGTSADGRSCGNRPTAATWQSDSITARSSAGPTGISLYRPPFNREIFNRAVEIGDHIDAREWAMFMILVARAVERIADNAVEIAEQTVFVVTGLFREFAYASSPPARSDRTDSSRLGMFGSHQERARPAGRMKTARGTPAGLTGVPFALVYVVESTCRPRRPAVAGDREGRATWRPGTSCRSGPPAAGWLPG